MDLDTSIIVFATSYVVISAVVGILVRELGHLLDARMLSIGVTGLSVGFGPELIGFTDQYGARWKLAPCLLGVRATFLIKRPRMPKALERPGNACTRYARPHP